MTICAAAICAQRRAIVLVSDLSVSWGPKLTIDRGMAKNIEVHPSWIAMVAGDVPPVTPILESVLQATYPHFPHRQGWQEQSAAWMRATFKSAFRTELERCRSDVLAAHRYRNIAELRRHGPTFFKPATWSKISAAIECDCEFLVCGIDSRHMPHLFTIDNAAAPEVHDRPGYHAIGTGAPHAIRSMVAQGLTTATGLAETIYLLCRAKRVAECDRYVGRSTFVVTLHLDHERYALTQREVSRLRRLRKSAAVRYLKERVLPRLKLKDEIYR